MTRINFDQLESLRKKHRNKKIVLCGGCFDLTHAGHVLFFEDCKKRGDILVVMVASDDIIKRDKSAGRPIINEHMRLKMIDSLKPVDYVFLDFIPPQSPHPLFIIDMVAGKLKPDFYVVNKDAWDMPYRKDFCKRHGVNLKILDRTAPPEYEEISTTKIIKKIKSI